MNAARSDLRRLLIFEIAIKWIKMAHGGARAGAGRKKGQVSKQTERRKEVAERALAEGISPLDVLLTAMRSAWDEKNYSAAATYARDAAPYVHPRLSQASVDQTVRSVDPAEQKPELTALRRDAASQQTPSAPQPAHDSEAEKRVTH